MFELSLRVMNRSIVSKLLISVIWRLSQAFFSFRFFGNGPNFSKFQAENSPSPISKGIRLHLRFIRQEADVRLTKDRERVKKVG